MVAANRKRGSILNLHRDGHSNVRIAKLLNVARSTVSKAVKRYQEIGTIKDRPHTGHPRSARTPQKISTIRSRIARNAGRSIRKMAKDIQISRKSVQRIVNITIYSQGCIPI